MDKVTISSVPKVEAGANDIPMTTEPPLHQPQPYQTTIDEAEASFFNSDRQLDIIEESHQPEPPTPPQRASRPDVAAEDLQLGTHGDDQIQQLQLAAQMSQALREVVATSSSSLESSYVPHQEHSLSGLQEELQEELQDEEADEQMHDQAHHVPEPHALTSDLADTQSRAQQNDQATIQQVIPNIDAPQRHEQPQEPTNTAAPHQRLPAPSTQSSSQTPFVATPHRPILVAAGSAGPTGGTQSSYALDDANTPRKRSKVSRACDECRRKKVKCDASSENGDETCSNCRRANVRCMFSRVPQKRGPSKGYIKELADRINSIEGKLGGQSVAEALSGESLLRRGQGEAYAASALGEDSRKRTFSHISTSSIASPSPNRPAIWPTEKRPAFSQSPSYSANGLALKPLLPREPQGGASPAAIRPHGLDSPHTGLQLTQHTSSMGAHVPLHQAMSPSIPAATTMGEHVYQGYMNMVHHVLPFLPGSQDMLDAHLAQCSPALRDAFVGAFVSAMASFTNAPSPQGSLAAATRLLADYDCERTNRNPVQDLIHLQCLILMIINVENFGPVSIDGQHEGPMKLTLLGRAAGLAYTMGIADEAMTINAVGDVETEQYVRIRAWWTLIILDRWNSISSATPLVISNDSVVLPHNLKPILGEENYRLTLLAYIMGHWTPMSVIAPVNSTPGAAARASATFHLNMEMWRVHFPSDITPNIEPILHLSYWHCRLLAFLFMPNSLITDVTWAVRESVRLLAAHPNTFSPLNHHFTALAAICLIEMLKSPKSHDEAVQLLNDLLNANIAPSAWDADIRAKIRDALAIDASASSPGPEAATTASQGLQHLADLATSTTTEEDSSAANNGDAAPAVDNEELLFRVNDNYGDLGFDPRPVLCEGYLKAIPARVLP